MKQMFHFIHYLWTHLAESGASWWHLSGYRVGPPSEMVPPWAPVFGDQPLELSVDSL